MKSSQNFHERRKSERKPFVTDVEYYVAADIFKGVSINISEEGIQLDCASPIEIEMRYDADGETREHRAQLRWVKENEDGTFSFGFKYVEPDKW